MDTKSKQLDALRTEYKAIAARAAALGISADELKAGAESMLQDALDGCFGDYGKAERAAAPICKIYREDRREVKRAKNLTVFANWIVFRAEYRRNQASEI